MLWKHRARVLIGSCFQKRLMFDQNPRVKKELPRRRRPGREQLNGGWGGGWVEWAGLNIMVSPVSPWSHQIEHSNKQEKCQVVLTFLKWDNTGRPIHWLVTLLAPDVSSGIGIWDVYQCNSESTSWCIPLEVVDCAVRSWTKPDDPRTLNPAWLCHLWVVWPLWKYLKSQWLGFVIYEKTIIIVSTS